MPGWGGWGNGRFENLIKIKKKVIVSNGARGLRKKEKEKNRKGKRKDV